MTHLSLVPEDKSEWFRCRKWIENALKYTGGTHTIEDIEDGIEDGEFHFFCSPNSAVVVEIITYPRMTVLNYFLIGGNITELKRVIEPRVSRWAKEVMGCDKAIGIGRKGLERVFAPSGFRYCWTAIVKDLT